MFLGDLDSSEFSLVMIFSCADKRQSKRFQTNGQVEVKESTATLSQNLHDLRSHVTQLKSEQDKSIEKIEKRVIGVESQMKSMDSKLETIIGLLSSRS